MYSDFVEVTQKHIDEGIRNKTDCMLALALKEKFPLARYISVGAATCIVKYDAYTCNHFKFDRNTQLAILNFDEGKPVKPFKAYYSEYI